MRHHTESNAQAMEGYEQVVQANDFGCTLAVLSALPGTQVRFLPFHLHVRKIPCILARDIYVVTVTAPQS